MSEWISVEDRLPEIDMNEPEYARCVGVIAWSKDWKQPRQLIYKSNGYAKTEKGREPRWEEMRGCLAFGIPSHWMPLPEPPCK